MRKAGLVRPLALSLIVPGTLFACTSAPEPELPVNEPESAEFAPMEPTPVAVQETQGGALQADWEKLTIAEQRKILLVEQYVEQARNAMARGFLQEAREEAARGLDLDPDNLKVQKLVAEISAMLGDGAAEPGALADELAGRYELKVQQLRSEAEDYLRRGNVAVGRGDHAAAVAEFTLGLDHIRWAPYSLDWGGLREEIEVRLAEAKADLYAGEEAARLDAEREAYAKIKEQEAAAVRRREQRVAAILTEAIDAFQREDYENAQDLADDVLVEDPRNERAADLRDASFRAGREKFRAEFLQRKREQYERWEEDMAELLVPWTGVITLPDAAEWKKNSAVRESRTRISGSGGDDAGTEELRAQLATTRVPGLQMTDVESLQEVIATLQTLTNLPLVVDPAADSAAYDEGAIFNFTLPNPLPVINVLDLVADYAGPEVSWTIKHDAVLFTTNDKVRGELTIHNHTVHDLTFGLTDFLGPRINRLRLLDELEDDDGGGPFGGLGERPVIIEEDQLTSLVTENVAKESWDGDGVSIEVFDGGNMVVVQTPDVQRQVAKFLEDLRLFSSSMVTIESKFMTIEDNWLQEIGVEFRGLDNPGIPFTDLDDVTNGGEDQASLGLDNSGTGQNNAAGAPAAGFFYDDGEDGDFKGATSNIFGEALGDMLTNIGGLTAQWSVFDDAQISVILRMIEKSSQVELINDQVLSVQNTQRAYVTVINQRAYIQDFDVEVAQFEAIADPQINVLHEGIVLDVRPTIHHDRRYLTLELQPTVAKVIALRDFSTGLGSNTSPVEFQLPELEVQSIFTTAVIPDGGSVLLGGLSRIRQIERRAEVPWLANIPIVGFLFKEEGYSDEKSSLMVMIRAWITDVREELARLER